MFVAIVDIALKPGTEPDFTRAFLDSNKEISKSDGFVCRRLLKSGDGSLRVMVEYDSREEFEKMHQGEIHEKWHKILTSHMSKMPSPRFFQVVAQ